MQTRGVATVRWQGGRERASTSERMPDGTTGRMTNGTSEPPIRRISRGKSRGDPGSRALAARRRAAPAGMPFTTAAGNATVVSAEELEAARRVLCPDEPGPAPAKGAPAAHAPSLPGFRTGTGRSCSSNAHSLEKMRKWLLEEEEETNFQTAANTAQRGRPVPLARGVCEYGPLHADMLRVPCRRGEVGARRIQAAPTRRSCLYGCARAFARTRRSQQSSAASLKLTQGGVASDEGLAQRKAA